MSAIDDIAKKTIEEISAELAQIGGAHDEFIQQSQNLSEQHTVSSQGAYAASKPHLNTGFDTLEQGVLGADFRQNGEFASPNAQTPNALKADFATAKSTAAFDAFSAQNAHTANSSYALNSNAAQGGAFASSSGLASQPGSSAFSSLAPAQTVAAGGADFARGDMLSPEYLFLRNLKERVEVLFEGLGQTKASEAEKRLELTLKFLEFLLATVQNRLDNLPK